MIKAVVAGLWIVAATLGAVFYSYQSAASRPEEGPPKPMMGGLDYVRTEVISVPLLTDGRVDGYFLARLGYSVDPKAMAKLSVPATALMSDQVFSYVYTRPYEELRDRSRVDIDALRNGIRDGINARVGDTLVHDVLVEQIDYLSKDDIRDNATRRRSPVKAAPAEEKPAASEH